MRVDRKRDRRLITRTNCEAKLRVYLDYKTSRWKVYSLRETHNHELTPPTDIRHIPKYNVMTDLDKSQVDDSLHKFGVNLKYIALLKPSTNSFFLHILKHILTQMPTTQMMYCIWKHFFYGLPHSSITISHN